MTLTLDDGTTMEFEDLSQVYDKVPRQVVTIECAIEDLPLAYRTLVEPRPAYWQANRKKLLESLLKGIEIPGVKLVLIPAKWQEGEQE